MMNHVVVIGLGNIGSHAALHVARLALVGRLTLIDPDDYERRNLPGQCIGPAQAGRPKAAAMAAVIRELRPELEVFAYQRRAEAMPVGRLRSNVILACVDSRGARRYISRLSRRLGVPLIDAGVEPGSRLARVSRYSPAHDAPCLECGWSESDYRLTKQEYTCAGEPAQRPSTGAPSALGGLAGALQALECLKVLEGRKMDPGECVFEVNHGRYFPTRHSLNPRCRFDHEEWPGASRLPKLPAATTFGELFDLIESRRKSGGVELIVEGNEFVTGQTCASCETEGEELVLSRHAAANPLTCPGCSKRMIASRANVRDSLPEAEFSKRHRSRSLAEAGLLPGDILTLRRGEEDRRLEIADDDDVIVDWVFIPFGSDRAISRA